MRLPSVKAINLAGLILAVIFCIGLLTAKVCRISKQMDELMSTKVYVIKQR